jgi:hypothetical protein
MQRRTLIGAAIALAGAAIGHHASAQDAEVSLFKVVSAKDDMVVGLTQDELAKFGPGVPLEVFAAELQRRGQLPVWQYASTRAAQGGDLVMSPVQRIIVIYPGTARIEPYRSALKVIPPAAR